MSENLTTEGISEFLDKYKNAKSFNSKEIRLTIHEAERLSIGIAILLDRYSKNSDKLLALQEQLLEGTDTLISGGGFD